MNSFLLVTATREHDDNSFNASTFLGISRSRMPEPLRPEIRATFKNSGPTAKGLPEIYNEALRDEGSKTDSLIFVHDDVFIHDWFIMARLNDALRYFDVVGIAGSRNPQLGHPSWGLKFDANLNPVGWQDGLQPSGTVGHGDYNCPTISRYGETPADCKLLDGLFLAINARKIKDAGVRFDHVFRFHCYDLDFCRSAAEQNLRIGTWPIAVTHRSGGNFESTEFKIAARKYLEKWKR